MTKFHELPEQPTYQDQVSGERLQDRWSSGFPMLIVASVISGTNNFRSSDAEQRAAVVKTCRVQNCFKICDVRV